MNQMPDMVGSASMSLELLTPYLSTSVTPFQRFPEKVPTKSYPSDVSDAEWEFLLPYLTLMKEDAPQREYPMRELFNALCYVVKTECHWRFLPHDFPPWTAVYQQAQRWLHASVFENIAHDLRVLVRLVAGRDAQPTATILDARTLQSTPESGAQAGFDGAKKK